MYCGSCIHDNTLAAALMRQGVEVALIPTYTPIRTDERDVSEKEIFYGGINVFLQQKTGLFRHTPRVIDRMLDTFTPVRSPIETPGLNFSNSLTGNW